MSKENRTKGLLVMDVDSTLINQEGIDLLGQIAGVGPQVADITERAMRGELDFEAALKERLSLLQGLPESVLDQVRSQITYTKGAKELVASLKQRGYKIGLVSGGFSQTVQVLAQELDLDFVEANDLEILDGHLTGRILGSIVTKETKKEKLIEWATQEGLDLAQTVAVGDGANDLLMIQTAGIGIAFCAKPVLASRAPYAIHQRDLTKVMDIIDGGIK